MFGDKDIAATLATHLAETAPREAMKIVRQPFEMPKPCNRSCPGVYGHLTSKLKLPATFIDEAHDQGLIFSDPRGNCVFARDKSSGVFKVGTGNKPFNQSMGKDGEPFVLLGTDNGVYVTDSPLEALSLKLMRPDSTVLATGGYIAADKLKPYLAQKEIYLAFSRDKTCKQIGDYLFEVFPKAQRIQPGQAESWKEYRQLQMKEAMEKKQQEAKQAQAAVKARSEAVTPTPSVN